MEQNIPNTEKRERKLRVVRALLTTIRNTNPELANIKRIEIAARWHIDLSSLDFIEVDSNLDDSESIDEEPSPVFS